MPARRATRVRVLAILNLVFGGLGLLVSAYSAFTLVMLSGTPPPGMAQDPSQQMQRYLAANVPGYEAFQVVGVAVSFLFDLMLLASGLGMLWYQNWARLTALTWAALSILNRVFTTAYTMVLVVPATTAFLNTVLPGLPPAAQSTFRLVINLSIYGGVCFGVLYVAYPIVVLCLLLTRPARLACETGPRGADEDDPDDDYPPPRRDDRYRDDRYRDDDRY